MSAIEDRLTQLDIRLPDPPRPVASYVPASISGSLLYVSGQLPFRDGELLATGPVPKTRSSGCGTTGSTKMSIDHLLGQPFRASVTISSPSSASA